jgi:hypothetical protein
VAALALEKSNHTLRIEFDFFLELPMIEKNSTNYHAVSTGKGLLAMERKAAGFAASRAGASVSLILQTGLWLSSVPADDLRGAQTCLAVVL